VNFQLEDATDPPASLQSRTQVGTASPPQIKGRKRSAQSEGKDWERLWKVVE